MGKINTVFIVCFFFILSLNAQHHIGVGGGYSQSIFIAACQNHILH